MPKSSFTIAVLAVCLISTGSAAAQGTAELLEQAERLRKTDKPASRLVLDRAQRALSASPDPLLIARAQFLECTWADEPPVAYRAVAVGLPAAERAGSASLRAKLLACRGTAHWFDGKTVESERDFAAAVPLARQAREAAVEADALFSLGRLQYTRGAMADALANVQAAYRINVASGNEKGRLDALTVLANIYADRQVAQYDRAIEYYRQLITAYERDGQPADVADTMFNLGGTYETKGDLVAAEVHYRRALAAFQKLSKPDDVAFTGRSLGSALMKQGRVREALPLFDHALAHYVKKGDADKVASSRQYRGGAYRRLGRPQEALADLAAARHQFELDRNTRFLERNIEETALAYESLGDWRSANDYRRRHAALQQELAASRRDELSSRLRVEFDAEKKEQENRALARENALRSAALREARQNQRLQVTVIVLTALLAVALAVLFWRQVADTRRLRDMAMTDELTRLPNRRHILAALDIALAAASRQRQTAAVIVFDIDRFKRINDTWGHAAGDLILTGVARTCRQSLRPSDLIGRTGGEEFLIVVPQATETQAAEIAERLRAAVEAVDFSAVAEGLRVTISLGVVLTDMYEPHAAMAAADALLYRAKEGGRNRVEMSVGVAATA